MVSVLRVWTVQGLIHGGSLELGCPEVKQLLNEEKS
jgi:hypothetical protein